jgi:hypothetical protein
MRKRLKRFRRLLNFRKSRRKNKLVRKEGRAAQSQEALSVFMRVGNLRGWSYQKICRTLLNFFDLPVEQVGLRAGGERFKVLRYC